MTSEIKEIPKIKKQKGILQIIFTILSFITFLIIYKKIILASLNPPYLLGFIFIIPTIIFAFLTFCVRKDLLKNWVANILILIISGCSIFLTFVFIILFAITNSTDTTTDINKYERILKINNYNTNPLLNHFPKSIPKEAKDTILFYTPQFLQGRQELYIKFSTDCAYIDQEIEKASKECLWNGKILSGINEDFLYNSYGLYKTTFNQVGYGDSEFSESPFENITEPIKDVKNLEVFLLDSKPYEENNWNHGYSYGIAVDKKESSIIYFEKFW